MGLQPEPRVRKRVSCKIRVGARRHAGIVLNVSPRGLYVQTSAVASPGTRVDIDLTPKPDVTIPLEAIVVWRRLVPRELRTDARGGFGVRIQRASEAYYELLSDCLPARRLPGAAPSGAPATAASPAARYRVRVGQKGGCRSRWLIIEADDPERAREQALAQVGPGWDLLEVEKT